MSFNNNQLPVFYQNDLVRSSQPFFGRVNKPVAQPEPQTVATVRANEAIKQAARDAIRCDPKVLYAAELDVQVCSGTVTLSGVVSDATSKAAAERDVCDIDGVNCVENLLKIGIQKKTSIEGTNKKPKTAWKKNDKRNVFETEMRQNLANIFRVEWGKSL